MPYDIQISPNEWRNLDQSLEVECPRCGAGLKVGLPPVDVMFKAVSGSGKKLFPESTFREAQLFDVLLSHYGRWVESARIVELLAPGFSLHSLYRLVRRLRARMKGTGWEVENRWGGGYRLANKDDGTAALLAAPIPPPEGATP